MRCRYCGCFIFIGMAVLMMAEPVLTESLDNWCSADARCMTFPANPLYNPHGPEAPDAPQRSAFSLSAATTTSISTSTIRAGAFINHTPIDRS
jgi:hypothetical protein